MSQYESGDGQRRQVTVLFADIVGFTNIAETLGEEGAFELVRDLTSKMSAIVEGERGKVQEYRGDGIMALFGAPVALEDAPVRACRAALKLQMMFADLAPRLTLRYGLSPQLRVGIHAGPVILGEVDDRRPMQITAIGDTVNLASRLESEAGPGETCVSEAIAALVEGHATLTDLGERQIKGKAQPQRVFRLDGLIEGVSRFDAARRQGLTSLVEREAELAQLDRLLAQATQDRRIAFAGIVGDAGIGKSRLMYEFRQRCKGKGVTILQGDCMADGASSAFLPFVDLVRSSFGLDKTDDAATTEQKLSAGLRQIGFEVEASVPYLLTLLGQKDRSGALDGLSADLIGVRMRQLLADLLWHTCKTGPVLLFVEDLHWIDPGSEQLLQRIAEAEEALPLLVICAYRPYYSPPWAAQANVTRLPLGPLTDEGTIRLLSEKLGVTDLGAELVRLAVEKIEGNPLYAEEIAKFLRGRQGEAPGASVFSGVVLPANLQNLIMERFDRLDDQTRAVLQTAAVAGRRFRADLIADVMGPQVPVGLCLHEAERLEILQRAAGPDADYIFSHALVQDAVYATLMTAQRRALHGKVGQALEARFRGREDDIADVLAHHFAQTDLVESAVVYLTAAGRRNLKIFSLQVAEAFFAQAAGLMDRHGVMTDPAFRADFLADWLEVQQWRADFDRSIRLHEERRDEIDALEPTRRYAQILALLGIAYVQQFRYDEGERLLQAALEAGERKRDQTAIAHAWLGQMCIECVRPRRGSFDLVRGIYDRITRTNFEKDHLYFQTFARFYMSWSMMIRGDLDPSLKMGLGTIEMGRRENYPGAIGFGSTAAAYNECFSENFDLAIGYAQDGVRLSGGIVDKMICLGMHGLALTLGGRPAEGLALLERTHRELTEMKYFSLYNIVDMPIGLALCSVGELSRGMAWLEKAIDGHRRAQNTHGFCVTQVVAGEIYLQMATGGERPDPGVLRRNLWFLLRRLPRARHHALRHYEAAIAVGREAGLHGVTAQALLGKARVMRLARKPEAALAALKEARAELSQIGWGLMQSRVEAEVASIRR